MGAFKTRPLQDDLSFGARITGVDAETLKDAGARKALNDVFEERGMIAFEDMERSGRLQAELSEVFGPLKEHPVKTVSRVDEDNLPGVIAIKSSPDMTIVEIDGEPRINWQPWHFDHCYNNELNRAGILREITPPPEGGMTVFADGIQIYNDLKPETRAKLETINIIYTLDLVYPHQKFGMPKGWKEIRPLSEEQKTGILAAAAALPRAIHPAVWTRSTGQKVLHMCGYMAVGVENRENAEGEALFHDVWDEILSVLKPYYHRWKPTDMVIWDNWRMLHQAEGCDPKYEREVHRTTIQGDYGFGRWETSPSVR